MKLLHALLFYQREVGAYINGQQGSKTPMLAAAASEEVPTSNGVNDQVKGLILVLLCKVLLLVIEHLISPQLLQDTMLHLSIILLRYGPDFSSGSSEESWTHPLAHNNHDACHTCHYPQKYHRWRMTVSMLPR